MSDALPEMVCSYFDSGQLRAVHRWLRANHPGVVTEPFEVPSENVFCFYVCRGRNNTLVSTGEVGDTAVIEVGECGTVRVGEDEPPERFGDLTRALNRAVEIVTKGKL